MNIIKIDLEKLNKMVDEYILSNNSSISMSIYTELDINRPIILMNKETLNQIKAKTIQHFDSIEKSSYPMFNGCYIAIADWLPFGEVQLK